MDHLIAFYPARHYLETFLVELDDRTEFAPARLICRAY
jgi:hypothetical protein